jgi:hypothetical protein
VSNSTRPPNQPPTPPPPPRPTPPPSPTGVYAPGLLAEMDAVLAARHHTKTPARQTSTVAAAAGGPVFTLPPTPEAPRFP